MPHFFADKYYFNNIQSFKSADTLKDADAIELNVPISAVFGQPGTFYNRQVIDPGTKIPTVAVIAGHIDESANLTHVDFVPLYYVFHHECLVTCHKRVHLHAPK